MDASHARGSGIFIDAVGLLTRMHRALRGWAGEGPTRDVLFRVYSKSQNCVDFDWLATAKSGTKLPFG
jgi:hypothetical protein